MPHIHHLHAFEHVHYDSSTHDNYPEHHHEWAGNNYFVTVVDNHVADDHDVAVGPDHDHPGYDLHFHQRRNRPTPSTELGG